MTLRIRNLALAACVAACAACTATSTISDNVCGNGVLDPGEDCDGGSACTSSCRIECSIADRGSACTGEPDGMCCPELSRCGVDGICHAPTGTVSSEITEPFDVTSFVVADIDGDDIADIFGYNSSSVLVRYGDAQSPLGRSVTSPSPVPGAASFGDINGDGRDDLVLPVAGGLFAFDTSTGAPEPIGFPIDFNPTAGFVHLQLAVTAAAIPATGAPAQLVTLDRVGTTLQLDSLTIGSGAPVAGAHPSTPCGGVTGNLVGHELHPFVDGRRTLVPFEFTTGTNGTTPVACVAVYDGTGGSGGDVPLTMPDYITTNGSNTTKTPATTPVEGETFFANVLGNTCPDLLVPALYGSTTRTVVFQGTGTSGACSVGSPIPQLIPSAAFAAITIEGLTTPTLATLVTSAGVIDVTPGTGSGSASATYGPVTTAPRPWTYATVADLDGDGRDDIITAGTSTDVEVLFQRPYTTGAQFADVTIQTTNTVQYLATGDFDGDGNGDIAIGTIDPTVLSSPADIEIAWGGTSNSFTVGDVGTFENPRDLIATNLIDASLLPGFDQFDDLIVAQGDSGSANPARYVAEYGSTSRGLTAPYPFQSAFGGASGALLRAVGKTAVIGNFGPGGTPAVFGVFAPSTGVTATDNHTIVDLATTTTYTDFVTSNETGYGTGSAAWQCPVVAGSNNTPLCLDSVHLTRVAEAPPAEDLMYVTRSDTNASIDYCGGYAASGATSITPLSCAEMTDQAYGSNAEASLLSVHSVSVFSLALSGEKQLFFTRTGSVNAAILWTLAQTGGGAPVLTDPIDINAEIEAALAPTDPSATVACFDGIEMVLGDRTVDGVLYGGNGTDQLYACNVTPSGAIETTQVWERYAPASGSGAPLYVKLLDLDAIETIVLRDGDINGDGLPDVLYTYGTSGAGKVQIHAYLQCDTHETGCTGGSGS